MDDKRSNQGIGTGFLADMLRDLQKQYEIDKMPKDKGKSGKALKKPAAPKGKQKGASVMPAGQDAKGTALPAGQDTKGAAMPGIHMMHVTDEADPRPGDMLLGIYRVESNAVKGGMGAVWRVHHTGWDVDLAMKRPHPEVFRTEEQKRNFTDECRYWMNLGLHPNIVSCYYVREIGGIPTIFSEWMENGSLESHIKNRTLYDGTREEVEERLLDIAIQFARGLHYAHENELIHQDVKPDNLLLARDWSAKVSDFGLAKARTMLTFLDGTATEPDYDPDATMVSPGGGRTPAYCSPEQAAGQLLTRRTDLYSWAVSVLEMYLGYKPWAHGRELTGPLVGTVCRNYFDMCTDWPVPAALQDLLEKCMETDPDDRPGDFAEVEAELLAIYRNVTGRRYTNSAPKGARDTADSLNNKAISHLDLGQEEEAVALLEKCVRLRHFDGALNLALYRWRKNITGVKAFLQTVDELEGPYWERRGELAQVRKQICLEACGLQEPPSFRLVTPQGFGDASLSSADVRDGKLLAVIRKHWKDGKKYYYVCHFDVDTGALLMQYPGDHEQPGIPCTAYENYTKLFDGGRMMYLNAMRTEERAVYDVLSQQRIHEQTDYFFNADRFVTRSFFSSQVFTSKGELLPEFQDGVPLVGKKIDGDRVYEITCAATWKPCARVAAEWLVWLTDGQFLIHTKRDSFLLYDVEKNTSCLLFSRGRQDGETVLKDPSRKIVITPGLVQHGTIYEYKPGRFVLCVYGRYFTLPDLQELKNGRFAEQTGPEPRVAKLDIKPYELSLREVFSGRSLMTVPVPELPVLWGKLPNYYQMLSDRKCGFALVFQPGHQVAWAVLHIDFCPSQTPQMPYRISTPVTTAAALEQERVDQQRLSEFHRAERGDSLRGMIDVYRDAVFDDHTGIETLHTMNTILSARCMKRGLLNVIGVPDSFFQEEHVPSLLKDMTGKWAFSPSGRYYAKCEKDEVDLLDYPSGKVKSSRSFRVLSKPCDDASAVDSVCFGQNDEVFISYTCMEYQKGTNDKNYRIACLGKTLYRDVTLLLLEGGGKSDIYLLGTTEDNRYLLFCRDDRKYPNTVSLELLDLVEGQICLTHVINDFVRAGEAFRRNDTLSMLSGKGGAMELFWDYEPIPPDAPVTICPSQIGFEVKDGILIKYLVDEEKDAVVIPDGITEIAPKAFKGCKVIRSVTVPEGVRVIGHDAFWGCSQLEKVAIHSHVLERIGEGAFYNCSELVHFYMAGNRLRTISDKLFESCRKLEMIELPESICEIGDSSFALTALKTMKLPASLQKIGDDAFYYSGLEQVELPAKLTSIGKGAFRHCNFTTIRIPSSVDTLSARVFSDCENLEIVENEGSIRSIERGAFSGCKQLKSVQVAYGACLDSNKIFNDNPKAFTAYGTAVSITEPTLLHCNVWDVIQGKRIYYSARFVPVPRGN